MKVYSENSEKFSKHIAKNVAWKFLIVTEKS